MEPSGLLNNQSNDNVDSSTGVYGNTRPITTDSGNHRNFINLREPPEDDPKNDQPAPFSSNLNGQFEVDMTDDNYQYQYQVTKPSHQTFQIDYDTDNSDDGEFSLHDSMNRLNPIKNEFEFHLCNCLKNPKNCLITLCCPCYTFGIINEKLKPETGRKKLLSFAVLATIIGLIFIFRRFISLYAAVPFLLLVFILVYKLRLDVKSDLDISKNFKYDLFASIFCCYCTLCQSAQEYYVNLGKGFEDVTRMI